VNIYPKGTAIRRSFFLQETLTADHEKYVFKCFFSTKIHIDYFFAQ